MSLPWTGRSWKALRTYEDAENFSWTTDYGRQVDKYYGVPTYW